MGLDVRDKINQIRTYLPGDYRPIWDRPVWDLEAQMQRADEPATTVVCSHIGWTSGLCLSDDEE